jgi:hypothetical protein
MMIRTQNPVSTTIQIRDPSTLIAYGIDSLEYLSRRGMTTVVALHIALKVW